MVQHPMRIMPFDGATERRSFLGLAGLAGAGLATLTAPMALGADQAEPTAQAPAVVSSQPTRRDIAILRFLAAAELVCSSCGAPGCCFGRRALVLVEEHDRGR